MQTKNKRRSGMNLSTQILLGLVLGVLAGLFFGEDAAALKVVGQAFIGLIQMSILPYMVVSLIGGIGGLSYTSAANLAKTGGLVLLASWLLAFFVIFALPMAFPPIEAGSFYSPSIVAPAEVDLIDLYIPVNPFSSLARTVVPAAAVFSVFCGVALIGVEKKQGLLDVLAATSETLTRVAGIVVRLTPIGVFAIAANAAGTMTFEDLGRLQTYILTFVVATLVLTFWILPGLVAVLTPFSYREVLRNVRSALLTGFVTGNLFIVLPMLVEGAKQLFEARNSRSEDTESYVEVLVPASFNFPNIGKLLTLLFILFAGWFTGRALTLGDYPSFSVMGLFTLFGGADLALPFLLDKLKIPSDMYQLYLVTGVVNGWFATLLAVMNLFAFTVAATCAATGQLRVDWRRLLVFVGISVAVFAAVLIGLRTTLSVLAGKEDIPRRTLMHLTIENPAPAVFRAEAPMSPTGESTGKNRLEQILERGTLRVGYNSDNLPFVFINEKGDLVGFDIELMHEIANQLELKIEFIPWTYETLFDQLNRGDFDVTAGGMVVNLERLAKASFSEPYMEVTSALVVPDHRRNAIESWRQIDEELIMRIGVTGQERAHKVKHHLPNTDVKPLKSYEEFFTNNPLGVDSILISAEAGSAWTVLYPEYAVVVPEPQVKATMALLLPKGDPDFRDLVAEWITLKKTDKTIDRLYEKWILGKDEEGKKPRWSIARDVLGWQ